MRGGEHEKSTLLFTHIPQHTTYMQAFTSKHSALAAQWDTLENDWKELRAKMAADISSAKGTRDMSVVTNISSTQQLEASSMHVG